MSALARFELNRRSNEERRRLSESLLLMLAFTFRCNLFDCDTCGRFAILLVFGLRFRPPDFIVVFSKGVVLMLIKSPPESMS